jgi:hypothetical protein
VNAKELAQQADNLYSKRTQLLLLWQEIALNFYPERADFTYRRVVGQEFAVNLATSYPILARRDLGNSLGTMLRPTAKSWFHPRVAHEGPKVDIEARRWLEWAEGVQRRAMYDRASLFTRATKEGDHDFSAFGQCVISIELNKNADTLLYRCWHLRDVAWAENAEGNVGQIFRKWKPTSRNLCNTFPGRCHPNVEQVALKDPFAEVECRHMVVESDMYDGKFRTPYVSIYYDQDHDKVLEEVGIYNKFYVIPRWTTVSGSQYGYSPATVAALPDARLLQAMTATILEAGEKFTNPPMVAVQEAIRGDVAIYAGGITWVDRDYDERLGEVLRPLTQDRSGMPMGRDMQADTRSMIAEAFFLNKLSMSNPDRGKAEMTAFEVGQQVQEYIRNALPIFEPMEMDYNGAVCEMTFDTLMRAGAFGSPFNMPKTLRGSEIEFHFESPLHDAIESEKGAKLQQAKMMMADAIALDPSNADVLDAQVALREALIGIGVPALWVRSEDEVAQRAQARQQQQNVQQTLANVQQGAEAAKALGEASQAMRPAA